ncbi:MAG: hypothetical protein V1799_14720 [bacterium]
MEKSQKTKDESNNIFWLILINVALGFATLVLMAIIGMMLFKEIRQKLRNRKTGWIDLEGLGITMYDGCKKLDEQKRIDERHGAKDSPEPPSKIE